MNTGELLLDAIREFPDDDTIRMAYADHLDEIGNAARAEFIRVQVELAFLILPSSSSDDTRRTELRRRERELLNDDNRESWFSIPGLGVQLEGDGNTLFWWVQPSGPRIKASVRRGFIDALLECTWEDWLAHGDAILAAETVQEVTLTTEPTGYALPPLMVIGEGVTGRSERWKGVLFEFHSWAINPTEIVQ